MLNVQINIKNITREVVVFDYAPRKLCRMPMDSYTFSVLNDIKSTLYITNYVNLHDKQF